MQNQVASSWFSDNALRVKPYGLCVYFLSSTNASASPGREARGMHLGTTVSSALQEHTEGSAVLRRVCRLTSQDVPGCGRDTADSTGLTGLGIQPAFSALRDLSSGRRGKLFCRGKHNTCSKDTNIQSKEQSLGMAQRHLLCTPRESRVCTMDLHIPSTLLCLSAKSRHFIFFPHSHNRNGTQA